MKYLFLVLVLTSSLSMAQTDLINHKSHSGTNKTFVPNTTKSNFGEVTINKEYKRDTSSSYKLVRDFSVLGGGGTNFILFKTKNKVSYRSMCMIDDEVLVTININDASLIETMKATLVEQLMAYRKQRVKQLYFY